MNELQLHTLLEQASTFAEEGKVLHAAQFYLRLIGDDPTLEEPYLRLAMLYSEQGWLEKAERVLAGGLQRHPRHPDFILLLGDIAAARRRYRQAIRWYSRLRDRRIPRVHFSLALVHMRMGNWHLAERELRLTRQLDPRFPRAHELLGEVLIRRNLLSLAIAELEKAVRIEPYSGASHRLLGLALFNMHSLPEALEELILAVDLNPEDAHAWQLCGETLVRLRRFAEAEYYLKRALALEPDSPDVTASYGFLYLHSGDAARAKEAFDTALRLRPGHPRALDGKLHLKILSE